VLAHARSSRKLHAQFMEPIGGSAEALQKFMQQELRVMTPIIKRTGIKIECDCPAGQRRACRARSLSTRWANSMRRPVPISAAMPASPALHPLQATLLDNRTVAESVRRRTRNRGACPAWGMRMLAHPALSAGRALRNVGGTNTLSRACASHGGFCASPRDTAAGRPALQCRIALPLNSPFAPMSAGPALFGSSTGSAAATGQMAAALS